MNIAGACGTARPAATDTGRERGERPDLRSDVSNDVESAGECDSAEDSSSAASTASMKSRSAPAHSPCSVTGPSDENQPLTLAPPPVQKEFASWEALDLYLQEYTKATHQVIMVA
ncbi:hypothetical protein PHYPSEUDO_006364 [Phytophthora pseudosyringae]|uniref:Uncharacterized protein n=1 Tax=Phytophthora pseudosyringae TaxID=221518 RepID=A0A8T1WFC3_9STRA|nr:hypothetical protein PHYPSEUDO_006364 [Phytophthora pseudosyringae]